MAAVKKHHVAMAAVLSLVLLCPGNLTPTPPAPGPTPLETGSLANGLGVDADSYYHHRIYSSAASADSDSSRIAVSTINLLPPDVLDDSAHPYYYYTRALQSEYARRHGYDFYVLKCPLPMNSTRTMHYQKILSTQLLMDLKDGEDNIVYDYVFWIDADVVITNMSVSLEAIIRMAPPDKHVILSGDTNVVNSAQVLWKNTQRSRDILQEIWDMHREGADNEVVPLYENGMLASMIGGCGPSDTPEEKLACYKSVDYDGRDKRQTAEQIREGNVFGVPLAPWARRDVGWVPQRIMNSYARTWRKGDFVFHAANPGMKKLLAGRYWLNRSLIDNSMELDELLAEHNFTGATVCLLKEA